MSKPTIAELEAMLEDKSVEIDIRPNGEVFVRSENDLLRAELEAARNVADAATAVDIARNAAVRVSGLPESVVWPLKILWGAEGQAGVALDAAVREYRKLMEGENAN